MHPHLNCTLFEQVHSYFCGNTYSSRTRPPTAILLLFSGIVRPHFKSARVVNKLSKDFPSKQTRVFFLDNEKIA